MPRQVGSTSGLDMASSLARIANGVIRESYSGCFDEQGNLVPDAIDKGMPADILSEYRKNALLYDDSKSKTVEVLNEHDLQQK